MPITSVVDHKAKLIRAAVVGTFTIDDMLDCVERSARETPGGGYDVLSDHRDITSPATRPQVDALSERLLGLRPHFGGARWAVVVSTPASYGMMRMLKVYLEKVPITLEIFDDLQAAERWLRPG